MDTYCKDTHLPTDLTFMCACVFSLLEPEVNKWFIVVDQVNMFTLHALLWLTKGQEFGWRLLELHSLKLVSAGIIWVSLKEVRPT